MQQAITQFHAMRKRFRWMAAVTLIFFAGMLIAGFQKPFISLILGLINASIYLFGVRPGIKQYNELYIRENILNGTCGRLRDKEYQPKVGVDVERFEKAAFFPKSMQVDTPLFTRQVKGHCSYKGVVFNVTVSQLTFHYRRDGKKPNVFLCGSWIELESDTFIIGERLMTMEGIPDTRFTSQDYLKDGWRLCEGRTDTFLRGFTHTDETLPEAALAAWNKLASDGGKAMISQTENRTTVFLPGRFYAINFPLQVEVSTEVLQVNRLPELETALQFAAACHKARLA